MSGIVGSITYASKEINNIDTNNTKAGMQLVSSVYKKSRQAEISAKEASNKALENNELDMSTLAVNIQKDMEDELER